MALTREQVALAHHKYFCLNSGAPEHCSQDAVDQADRDYADQFIDEILPLIPEQAS